MKKVVLLLVFSTFMGYCQYDGVKDIPLPERLADLSVKIDLFNMPNPNFPVFSEDSSRVVWKHSTSIYAKEPITVVETGAYLLYNGTWVLRESFGEKMTQKMFDTKTLKLDYGDSIIFKNNWRSDRVANTGWNFWYVLALDEKGDTLLGYEVLQTTGKMKDATQVIPLSPSKSTAVWTGKAGDSDYTLSGSLDIASGRMIVNHGNILAGEIHLDMTSISHEIPALIKHLKSKDFFNVKKHPKAVFTITEVLSNDKGVRLTGVLGMIGAQHQETIVGTLKQSNTHYVYEGLIEIDRTKYGMLYASSKDKDDGDYKISDTFTVSFKCTFTKDYPGALPWNTVKKD